MKPHEISDDDAVRRLLDEAEVAPSDRLTSSLLAFRSAGQDIPAPEPSPELLAFMTPPVDAPAVAPIVPLRRRRNVRSALMVTAALAGTGLGVTGVAAANPDFRSAADQAVQNVVGFFAPTDGQAEAPDQAQPGVPAGGPVAPSLDQPNNSDSGSEADTGSDKDTPADTDSAPASADPAAPGKSLAPGQQTENPGGGNRSGNGERNAEHTPATPFRDGLPAVPPLDGTLPSPSDPDRPQEKSGKVLPLPDGTLPSDDPARIPELPVVPEPQR
ncbi:hypothetical protein ACMX2H_05405 [Arthrobacter sulfonylureivorans]|uniref:hypothetical protein n=1 Tax=Arthrobacter sulfonylureivorans TaxID=2486855 RepID=UPI0039E29B7D